MIVAPFFVLADCSPFRYDNVLMAARSRRHAKRIVRRWIRKNKFASAEIYSFKELKHILHQLHMYENIHGRNGVVI